MITTPHHHDPMFLRGRQHDLIDEARAGRMRRDARAARRYRRKPQGRRPE